MSKPPQLGNSVDVDENPSAKSDDEELKERGFKLVKHLGNGAFARVFLATHRSTDPTRMSTKSAFLACKVIDTKTTASVYRRKFLQRELDILSHCDHPHIIFVHSIFQRQNKYYIFMRYAERGDLFDYLVSNGALTEEQSAVWVRQLVTAIQYLHTMEVAHRDLKCENVLITQNFNVKLSDFGFVRSCRDEKSFEVTMSQTFCGSLTYVAPEIIKGSPYEPKRADMWSFGVLIFMMLNKAHPFDSTHLNSLYQNQMKRNWKFSERKIHMLSSASKLLVDGLLEPDATKRWTIERVMECDWLKSMLDEGAIALTPDEQIAIDSARAYQARIEAPNADSKLNIFTSRGESSRISISHSEFKYSPYNESKPNAKIVGPPT